MTDLDEITLNARKRMAKDISRLHMKRISLEEVEKLQEFELGDAPDGWVIILPDALISPDFPNFLPAARGILEAKLKDLKLSNLSVQSVYPDDGKLWLMVNADALQELGLETAFIAKEDEDARPLAGNFVDQTKAVDLSPGNGIRGYTPRGSQTR